MINARTPLNSSDGLHILIDLLKKGSFVTFNLVIISFILAMIWLGNGKMTMNLVLFSTMVSTVLTKTGELTLRISQLTTIKAWLPTAFVVGFAAISLPMVALTLICNISALTAFVISTLSVLSLTFYSSGKAAARPSTDWADTAIALFLAITIGFLIKNPASSFATLLNTGYLPVWSDYFIHGVTIASFGSPFATGVNMEIAGTSRGFYHYAPFMIPAAFQTVSGMSGLALSTSILLPLGLLIAAFGSYEFSVELGGQVGGLLALTAMICLPAYSVFIQSGWFDFYWLLSVAPGSGYAIGVSAVVCASTVTYLNKNDSSNLLCFTMLLLFSLVLIRVHMFMLLAPAIVIVLLIHRWPVNIHLVIWAVVSMVAIIILVLHFSTHLHSLWMEFSNPYGYLNDALLWSPVYGKKIELFEYPLLTVFAQLLVVCAAVLGIYFILYPLFLRLSVHRFGFQIADALPLLLLMSFVGLMLFAPSPGSGDFTEYKHRHFPLLYVIIAIYTITYACNLATNYLFSEKIFRQCVYVLVICVTAVTIRLNWISNPERPNVKAMPWAERFYNQPIAPGLFESAKYIKTHARHGDVLAMDVTSLGFTPNSPMVEVISLSGVPAFISRPELMMKGSQSVRKIVAKRLDVLQELSSMNNWPDAQKVLLTNGIRWFLALTGEKPKWDPCLKNAAFSSNGVSVYDAGISAGVASHKSGCPK
ncbi:MAG: hypothetical protein ACLP3B_12895 [Syntrophobacteraceae bacterium]